MNTSGALEQVIPSIPDDETYQQLLAECSRLVELDPPQDSAQGQRLLALADALEAYEGRTFII